MTGLTEMCDGFSSCVLCAVLSVTSASPVTPSRRRTSFRADLSSGFCGVCEELLASLEVAINTPQEAAMH